MVASFRGSLKRDLRGVTGLGISSCKISSVQEFEHISYQFAWASLPGLAQRMWGAESMDGMDAQLNTLLINRNFQ
jgi:hypothetical protein